MDEIDAEIIKILCKDARTPFKRIGKMLGVGTDTVFRRFRKLQEEGIITGSTVILSSKACGIKGLCGLFIKVKSGSSLTVIRSKIVLASQIIFAYPEWGEYDFYVDLYFQNYSEIVVVIENLRKIKEIVVIDPIIYTQQDWYLPSISFFEGDVPSWCFNLKK